MNGLGYVTGLVAPEFEMRCQFVPSNLNVNLLTACAATLNTNPGANTKFVGNENVLPPVASSVSVKLSRLPLTGVPVTVELDTFPVSVML